MQTNAVSQTTVPYCGHKEELSLVEKLFPLWVTLAMVLGLLLGKLFPDFSKLLGMTIPLGLFLMIYPAMAKLHIKQIQKASSQWKPVALILFFNYLINPFLLWFFGYLFLRDQPELWTALILLGVAPCIAMVLVWTDLSKGNNGLALVLMAWNSLIQMITTPLFIWLIIGTRIHLDISMIVQSVVLYLALPLILGLLTRHFLVKGKGEVWYEDRLVPQLNNLQLVALLLTLVVIFALKGEVVLQHPEFIWQMAIPLVLFFVVLFLITLFAAKKSGLNYEDSVAVGFNATGRNFELSIAIAITAFAAMPLIGVATVIGPLIEVPVMLGLVWFAKRMAGRWV